MKLNYDRKSKDPTYFIQQGIRNGKKTTTRNIARIGKHSELLKITDDPLAYAKEQVEKLNRELKENNNATIELSINFSEKLKHTKNRVSSSTSLNIGYLFLQKIYHDLGLKDFFREITKDTKITFDPNQVNRFMTFSRIMDPGSKLASHRLLDRFYEKPDFDYVHILRSMDLLKDHYEDYISHLFDRSGSIVKRDVSVCYYDCTNYYFEVECPDEDYVDEVTGECIKGLRKYGKSKEHRPNPIVQMGLFMDSRGIPLSMCVTPGSDNEQTTALPLEKQLMKMFKGRKFIYCADAGLGSYNIRKFNSMGGRAFVITQSIKKMSDTLKTSVFNDYDYRLLSTDAPATIEFMKSFDRFDENNRALYDDRIYKVINADKILDLGLYEEITYKNGNTRIVKAKGTLKQKIIITFSRKMMEYQRAVRNRQIERAKAMLENLDPETYKKGPHDVTRFIKREKSTDEISIYSLDQSIIEEEEKYDGFYAIATNLDDHPQVILDISSQRYKIEDCFRIMKTNFSARPVFHHNRDRIIAHFMICFTALLIYRLLEAKLDDYGMHFTVDEIIATLKNMEVANLEDICYMSTYTSSELCTALNAIFDLGLDKKYYQPKELNKIIRKIL